MDYLSTTNVRAMDPKACHDRNGFRVIIVEDGLSEPVQK